MKPVYSKRHTPKDVSSQTVRKKRHKKDFSWNERTKNPFHTPHERKIVRERITVCMLIVVILSTFGIVLYHPMFQVKIITTTGLQRIPEQAFTDATIGIFDSFSPLFIIPGTNYFFLHIEKTAEILTTRFPLASISITKTFPNQVSIAVTEKVSTIIYDNGSEYSYIGLDGTIIETIRTVGDNEWIEQYTTSTSTLDDGTVTSSKKLVSRTHTVDPNKIKAEMGDYPYIYHIDADTPQTKELDAIILSPDVVEQILTWHQESKYHSYIPEIYFVEIREKGRSTKLMLDHYRYILIDATTSAKQQIEQLQQALTNIDIDTITYIDLRYKGRVYWQ